jgi:predicted ATP-dependent endonuclease of OLD family
MRVERLTLSNIGGVTSTDISFAPGMNVVCGPNGIGKSTILDAIAHFFIRRQSRQIKRNVNSESGEAKIHIQEAGSALELSFSVSGYDPHLEGNFFQHNLDTRKLIYVRSNRSFDWTKLVSIAADPETNDYVLGERNIRGISVEDTKNWLVNRFLYSAHEGALSSYQVENLQLAKKSFAVLDSSFQFSHVVAKTNEIVINTPSGAVFFEYLSSGFKASVSIFIGIIKEIEYRFSGKEESASSFDGIILIDEVETHLHPVWQTKITQVLKRLFPSAQFIISTHSPHVIQGVGRGEVISLSHNGSGVVSTRPSLSSEFGLQMWSVEEILADVMGMPDARSEAFRGIMAEFEKAVKGNDRKAAERIFHRIRSGLHPSSSLHVVMQLQIQSIHEITDDQD